MKSRMFSVPYGKSLIYFALPPEISVDIATSMDNISADTSVEDVEIWECLI